MKFIIFIFTFLLVCSAEAQVLDELKSVNKFVHAKNGLAFRATPSYDSEKLGQIEYGTELRIISYSDSTLTINGLRGKWAEVSLDKQLGYVFDAYLSLFKVVELEDYHPHLKDYLYSIGTLMEGDKDFEINDDPQVSKKAVFDIGDYQFLGDECDSEEKASIKNISVQEAYIVLSAFIPTYGGFSLAKNNFKWDEAEGVYANNFTNTENEFSRWHHVTFTQNKKGEYDYLEVYFDWEGGGGHLRITEDNSINGVKVTDYYGCH